jgi:hypothetical protein
LWFEFFRETGTYEEIAKEHAVKFCIRFADRYDSLCAINDALLQEMEIDARYHTQILKNAKVVSEWTKFFTGAEIRPNNAFKYANTFCLEEIGLDQIDTFDKSLFTELGICVGDYFRIQKKVKLKQIVYL